MHTFKTKLLSILLLPPFFTYAETPNPTGHNPNFINSPNINPNITSAPIYNTEIKPQFITNTTSTINAVGVQMRDVALKIMEQAQKTFTPENYHQTSNYIKQLIWNYRYNIVAGTIVGIYSTAHILLLTDYYYLKDNARWAHWKSHCTFKQLCEIPHTELTQELIRAIGEHHYNKKNPNDSAHPLITFIATIEAEINICKRYLAIAKAIKQLHLMAIFPTNDAKISQIGSYLERCLFVRHIFLSWLTERNLITKALKNRQFYHIKRLI